MKVCAKCKKEFPSSIKLESGKRLSLTARKYCIECNPLYSRNLYKGNSERVPRNNIRNFKCKICGIERKNKSRNNECSTCINKRIRNSRKEKAVKLLGSKCEICGYNKSIKALCFHHIDPKTKMFTISRFWNIKWLDILEEINKCQLLCANCHMELH